MKPIALRALTAVAALLLVVVPLSAAGTPGLQKNIPGNALPTSPVYGSLDSAGDTDDVFSVTLEPDTWFFASTDPQGATPQDIDLYLFGPTATSVGGQTAAVSYSESKKTTSERILYRVPPGGGGTYYLNPWAFSGYGRYYLEWGFPTVHVNMNVNAPPSRKWGKPTTVKGIVRAPDGTRAAGERVFLYAKPYGAATFKKTAEMRTDSLGVYRFYPIPTSRTTYVVKHLGSPRFLPAQTPETAVIPYAYLTSPYAPKRIRPNVAFTIRGYLKPKHKTGVRSVKIRCYRLESGKWVLRRSAWATNYKYGTYTKYSRRLKLPRGEWKFTATVAGDNTHRRTISKPRYRKVY